MASLIYIIDNDSKNRAIGESLVLCRKCAGELGAPYAGDKRTMEPYAAAGAACDWCGASGDPTVPGLKLERGRWVLA